MDYKTQLLELQRTELALFETCGGQQKLVIELSNHLLIRGIPAQDVFLIAEASCSAAGEAVEMLRHHVKEEQHMAILTETVDAIGRGTEIAARLSRRVSELMALFTGKNESPAIPGPHRKTDR